MIEDVLLWKQTLECRRDILLDENNGLIYLFNKSRDCNGGRALEIPNVHYSRVCCLSYTYSTNLWHRAREENSSSLVGGQSAGHRKDVVPSDSQVFQDFCLSRLSWQGLAFGGSSGSSLRAAQTRPSWTPSCTSQRRGCSGQTSSQTCPCLYLVPKATQSLATDTLTMGLGSYLKGELYSEPAPKGHIIYTKLVALDGALNHFEDRLQLGPLGWRVDRQ